MRLDMEAVPKNKITPINLAQHTYWNLAGHNSGNVLEHLVQISGSQITPVDENSIPTGELLPVKDTAFDFTSEKKVGSSIREVPGLGYDHNYVLDSGEKKEGLKHVAKVKDPASSRVLNLWTDSPGVQFYTANYVNGVAGKDRAVYDKTFRIMLGDPRISKCHQPAKLPFHCCSTWETSTSTQCCLSFQQSNLLTCNKELPGSLGIS
ncbi:hypothetical protein OIU77_001404 [Salix suchowensis]|uniref:Aldose 1-epimerase n=1 Tax=Salix suchowensis TaxID=1278906 RepID=A0ABQ9B1A1_9ROSI|nr:hypothetical protein OIU77_001404 [Salix suchowensis]